MQEIPQYIFFANKIFKTELGPRSNIINYEFLNEKSTLKVWI